MSTSFDSTLRDTIVDEYTNYLEYINSSNILKDIGIRNKRIMRLFSQIHSAGLNEERNVNMNVETKEYNDIVNEYKTKARTYFPNTIKVYPNLVELFIDIEHPVYPLKTVQSVINSYLNFVSGICSKEDIVDLATDNMTRYIPQSEISREKLMENMF